MPARPSSREVASPAGPAPTTMASPDSMDNLLQGLEILDQRSSIFIGADARPHVVCAGAATFTCTVDPDAFVPDSAQQLPFGQAGKLGHGIQHLAAAIAIDPAPCHDTENRRTFAD